MMASASIVAIALALFATVAPARAAETGVRTGMSELQEQLRKSHYARIRVDGHTHVLIKPRQDPEGLRYEEIQTNSSNLRSMTGPNPESFARIPNPVPWSRIDRLEKGERSRERGAMIGAFLGVLTGIALVALWDVRAGGPTSEMAPGAEGYALGTAVFGLAGAGIGALFPTTQWKRLPQPVEIGQR